MRLFMDFSERLGLAGALGIAICNTATNHASLFSATTYYYCYIKYYYYLHPVGAIECGYTMRDATHAFRI